MKDLNKSLERAVAQTSKTLAKGVTRSRRRSLPSLDQLAELQEAFSPESIATMRKAWLDERNLIDPVRKWKVLELRDTQRADLFRLDAVFDCATSEGRAREFQRLAMIVLGYTPILGFRANQVCIESCDALVDEVSKQIYELLPEDVRTQINLLCARQIGRKHPWRVIASELHPHAERLIAEAIELISKTRAE
ncbi:MAG: hypothetical protein NDI61_01905 [Bdellovibrionaceae bacterium]|nr:hypothetical protein [Pseudobdellovibrionaceae bacterium]